MVGQLTTFCTNPQNQSSTSGSCYLFRHPISSHCYVVSGTVDKYQAHLSKGVPREQRALILVIHDLFILSKLVLSFFTSTEIVSNNLSNFDVPRILDWNTLSAPDRNPKIDMHFSFTFSLVFFFFISEQFKL